MQEAKPGTGDSYMTLYPEKLIPAGFQLIIVLRLKFVDLLEFHYLAGQHFGHVVTK